MDAFAKETKPVELLTMEAVMAEERKLGYEPVDVSNQKCICSIESRIPVPNYQFQRCPEVGRVGA